MSQGTDVLKIVKKDILRIIDEAENKKISLNYRGQKRVICKFYGQLLS